MHNLTLATDPWSWCEPIAGVTTSIEARRESREARPSIQAVGCYDEVDARLMDTFPASDAVARY